MWRWSADQGEEKRHPCREVLQGDVFSSILPKDTLVYSSGSEGSVPIRSFLIGIWEKAMAPHSSSCLENPMDGGAWWAAVHGVARGWTRLSDFTFTFHFPALEKEMATHSSVLAWRIPGMGEPGGLLSMGSHRVGHDWSGLAAAANRFA